MDFEEYTSNDHLYKVTGVDIILDGHNHKVYKIISENKNNEKIPIVQTGIKLKIIWKINISNNLITSEKIKEVPEPSEATIKVTLEI